MIQQRDIYGNVVADPIGVKDPDAIRAYFLRSNVYTMVDVMKIKTGLPKSECVTESVEIANRLMAIVGSFEEINKVINNPIIIKIIKIVKSAIDDDEAMSKLDELLSDNGVETILSSILDSEVKSI